MSTHYTVRGGNSTAGAYCGSLLVHFAVSPSIYNWHVGAALSFKTGTHYTIRGGDSPSGSSCGAFCVNAAASAGAAVWSIGAALSFILHIILVMVVLLMLVIFVVHSVFMLTLLLLFLAGAMALLYHLKLSTHYTTRGGISVYGAVFGAFSVAGSVPWSYAHWDYGAAL